MEEITVAKVSHARDTKTLNTGCLAELGRIRDGTWKTEVKRIREEYQRALQSGCDPKEAVDKLKKQLPGILWSGTFTRRANEGLIAHSGLLCADLDGLNGEIEAIREKLKASLHCLCVFRSPTDTGLKALFRVPADGERHAASFRAVQKHVRDLTGMGIDEACKDVARLCFVSYDTDLWINEEAVELKPLAEAELPAKPVNGTGAGAGVYGGRPLGSRKEIAERILGAIEWTSETEGLCECPGKLRHTTGNGERDCKIHLDGAPTITCFHNSCRGIVNGVNHQLRSDIGKAERSEMKGIMNSDQSEKKQTLPPPLARRLGELSRPPENDPDELIKHRFLCRGGGMLMVGPTGIGKSSFSMQAMICWALGREAFGFKPARPLKSLLIQAENDDGDLAEMRDGVMAGLGLSEEERAAACEMVMVVQEDRRTGLTFTEDVVKPLLDEHRPDLLWIDPALSYLGGEASSQKDVGGFLRNMLNPLLREYGCGCVIVHHTNKPAAGKEKNEWKASDFAYLGSGSIEWAGWARGVIALRSIGSHSIYELWAAKRGARLRWKLADGVTTTYVKVIAHAKEAGSIYWREVEPEEMPKEKSTKNIPNTMDVLTHVPLKEPISKSSLRDKANAAGIALNRINPLIDELVHDGKLHVWIEKRTGTNPRQLLARFPQPEKELL